MKPNAFLVLLLSVVFPALGQAASPTEAEGTLKAIAQKAVLNSPEVTSKWHNYKAAEEEMGVGRGGYFPRVDLTAGTGRESLEQPPGGTTNKYTRSGYGLSLNQMLF